MPASAHAAKAKPPKIAVALGDSLSTGVQPDTAGKNQATKAGYPYQLAARSGAKLKNFGCGGATSESLVTSDKKCFEHFGKLPFKNKTARPRSWRRPRSTSARTATTSRT